MIRYTLKCDSKHGFDMWFADSATYDSLVGAGHVACPECGSTDVEKGIMAPNVAARSGDKTPGPREMMRKLAEYRATVMAETTDVGKAFPEQARDMHEGLIEHAPIRGEASPEDVKSLREEGVPILPVPPEPPKEN
jgi:hypothetical protein